MTSHVTSHYFTHRIWTLQMISKMSSRCFTHFSSAQLRINFDLTCYFTSLNIHFTSDFASFHTFFRCSTSHRFWLHILFHISHAWILQGFKHYKWLHTWLHIISHIAFEHCKWFQKCLHVVSHIFQVLNFA